MKANDIPALSIGIVYDGKLAYFEGFGTLDRESSEKVDEQTVYQIGSDTKKLTAIIVKHLVQEGKLDLDASIATYLGHEVSADTKEQLRQVTVRQLLRHTAGVPYRAASNKRIDGDPMLVAYSTADLLKDINGLMLASEPGTKFGYSNFGYALIGYICERASSQTYAALLKKYVAGKYGLANTFVHPSHQQVSLVATPYRKDDRAIKSQPWNMGRMTPAGGVYSNVRDLSLLMIEQIMTYRQQESGEIEDSPLILTTHADSSHYGLGLGKTVRAGRTWYGHGGDLDGFASAYVFSPEYERGLIILTTSGGSWVGRLENEIKDVLFR
ncbi:MAG: serine hydrolase domain-containing protein [Bacteroidota bacterium]